MKYVSHKDKEALNELEDELEDMIDELREKIARLEIAIRRNDEALNKFSLFSILKTLMFSIIIGFVVTTIVIFIYERL
jgi:hypothetical protein